MVTGLDWRMIHGSGITFRPLTERDLPQLADWLNKPHLRRFFQKKTVSLAEVQAKYGPRARGETPTRCHLAILGGRPFGYLQNYRIADYPDWAAMIGENDGIGIDLAIFEPDLIGKGLGREMLARYLSEIAFPRFAKETRCFIAHEIENVAALRNSDSIGFRYVRNFLEGDLDTVLLVLDRDELGDARG